MAVIKINEHEMSLDEQEQYQRRDCVEIKGIPTTEDENTSDLVVQVADLLDVELEESVSVSVYYSVRARLHYTEAVLR